MLVCASGFGVPRYLSWRAPMRDGRHSGGATRAVLAMGVETGVCFFRFLLKTHLPDVLHKTHQWDKASRGHTTAKIWSLVVSAMGFPPFLLGEEWQWLMPELTLILSGCSDKIKIQQNLVPFQRWENCSRRRSVRVERSVWEVTPAQVIHESIAGSPTAAASLMLFHLNRLFGVFFCRILLSGQMFCWTQTRRCMPGSDNRYVSFQTIFHLPRHRGSEAESGSEEWSPSISSQAVMLRWYSLRACFLETRREGRKDL